MQGGNAVERRGRCLFGRARGLSQGRGGSWEGGKVSRPWLSRTCFLVETGTKVCVCVWWWGMRFASRPPPLFFRFPARPCWALQEPGLASWLDPLPPLFLQVDPLGQDVAQPFLLPLPQPLLRLRGAAVWHLEQQVQRGRGSPREAALLPGKSSYALLVLPRLLLAEAKGDGQLWREVPLAFGKANIQASSPGLLEI